MIISMLMSKVRFAVKTKNSLECMQQQEHESTGDGYIGQSI